MGYFACKIYIKESWPALRGILNQVQNDRVGCWRGKIKMEFFRQNQKAIIIVIAVTFIGFTLAPVIMSMLTMK